MAATDDGFVEIPGTEGGILKKIIREGTGEEHPDIGNEVSVHYVGTLTADGSKFDSSRDRSGTFDFVVGVNNVIKGWDVGIPTMKKGELCILRCRSDYAYGEKGSPPKIPGGASLDFEVELFSWKVKEKEAWEMSTDEKVEKAEQAKVSGNAKFKEGNYKEAKQIYDSGLKYVKQFFKAKTGSKTPKDDDSDEDASGGGSAEDETKARDVTLALALNAAQARLKLKDEMVEVIRDCTLALTIDPKNVKAFFRRGQAHVLKGDFGAAKTDLLAALDLDPSNADVALEIKRCEAAAQKSLKAEKAMYGKMFG